VSPPSSALFLGEVMGYTPCVLCWYQRIAMFPLVLILFGRPLFHYDPRVSCATRCRWRLRAGCWRCFTLRWLPRRDPGARQAPASRGRRVPLEQVVWFGFVTLPMLSVLAFSSIMALLLMIHFKGSK
jgi:disulfide bond formation protein DsbB